MQSGIKEKDEKDKKKQDVKYPWIYDIDKKHRR